MNRRERREPREEEEEIKLPNYFNSNCDKFYIIWEPIYLFSISSLRPLRPLWFNKKNLVHKSMDNCPIHGVLGWYDPDRG